MEYDNNFTGAIFRNTRKQEGSKQPDATGNCIIDGKEYWVSGWIKSSKNGNRFTSLAFTLKEPVPSESSSGTSDDFDEDLPF